MTSRFLPALTSARCPVVMEVKRHDGHGCDLLGDRVVADLVADYERSGAACVSVVTGRWFGGSQHLLDEVRAATTLPLLQKDFITSPRHVQRAADGGADAVLLTATLLVPSCLQELVECALAAGLDPFVEVANEDEIRAVPQPGRCLVAVNNKDIRHRERGPGTVERSVALLPAVRAAGAGCAVSASGIDRPEEAAALVRRGYDGVLVGRSVLRSTSVGEWADTLRSALDEPALA